MSESKPVKPEVADMDVAKLLDQRTEAFQKRVLLSSGAALLLAAAARLPAWEVASPVGWLVGTVNVGFLPIFGPLIVLGTFCFTYLALHDTERLRRAVVHHLGAKPTRDRDLVLRLVGSAGAEEPPPGWPLAIAAFVEKLWVFVVPVVAYAILMASFFDFVRPSDRDPFGWQYPTRGQQVRDLLAGSGGWSGFRPITPAITSALAEKASAAEAEQKVRLQQLSRTIPWIYPPVQTWAYLVGFLAQVFLSMAGWRETGPLPRMHGSGSRKSGSSQPGSPLLNPALHRCSTGTPKKLALSALDCRMALTPVVVRCPAPRSRTSSS